MSILDFGLGLAGMPQETIDKLDAEMPTLAKLARAIQQVEPILETPLMKAWPIIEAEFPDIKSVLPLLAEIAAFVNAKMKE
jgi:hypothetical protein